MEQARISLIVLTNGEEAGLSHCLQTYLDHKGLWNEDMEKNWEEAVNKEIDAAMEKAENAPQQG